MKEKAISKRQRTKKTFFGIFCLTIIVLVLSSWFFDYFLKNGLLVLLILVYLGGYFSLTIWMLADCLSRDFESKNTKKNWIGALLFFGIFGALIYFIKVKSRELDSDITINTSE